MHARRGAVAGIRHWLPRHKRFLVLGAVALAVYALGAYALFLPPVRLPPSVELAGLPASACADALFLQEVQERETILFVPFARIPEQLIGALLQQEDKSFYQHGGVNWVQVGFALLKDVAAGRYRYGASTITMQLMRQLFLGKERSLARKLREAAYALQAERRLGKSEILELYLNMTHWGPGIRGVGAASCYYFGVPPDELGSQDALRLVAVLPSPERYGPVLRAAVANRVSEPRSQAR